MITRLFLVLALATVGCGDGSDAGGGTGEVDATPGAAPDAFETDPTARYFPIEVGNTWTYDVQHLNGGSSGLKLQTVEALEELDATKAGVSAYRLRSEKPSGEYTLSWQEDTGDALVRHLEVSYDSGGAVKTDEVYTPGKLRLDEAPAHLERGASYTTSYEERVDDVAGGTGVTTIQKEEVWTIEAVDEQVTVPAGTYSCVRIRRVASPSGSDKRYWFARGVGKVREESATQIEELRSFDVAP